MNLAEYTTVGLAGVIDSRSESEAALIKRKAKRWTARYYEARNLCIQCHRRNDSKMDRDTKLKPKRCTGCRA